MKPINPGGHPAYQEQFVTALRQYYPVPDAISSGTWEIMERFYALDLSFVDGLMEDLYSSFGPQPRLPSCMLRSMLLALQVGVTSFTQWAAQLKINHLYAIISGFTVGDTPGVGTFYDFVSRLWLSEEKNFAPHERVPKTKPKRPGKKGEKADSIEKVTVEDLLALYEETPASTSQPYSRLFHIYKEGFLDQSSDKGLIEKDSMTLAGDGTPVYVGALERSHSVKTPENLSRDESERVRWYSQPDCDIGWDSHRNCWYFGYDLYFLTSHGSECELPVFPLLSPASRHNSIGFTHAWFSMKAFLPDYQVSKVLLDSAHDAMPLYKYFRQQGISPFIDLNGKRGRNPKYKDDFELDKDGIPICSAGLRMNHDGSEPSKNRVKFRCPMISKGKCICENPCSDAVRGRTVHLSMKDNP